MVFIVTMSFLISPMTDTIVRNAETYLSMQSLSWVIASSPLVHQPWPLVMACISWDNMPSNGLPMMKLSLRVEATVHPKLFSCCRVSQEPDVFSWCPVSERKLWAWVLSWLAQFLVKSSKSIFKVRTNPKAMWGTILRAGGALLRSGCKIQVSTIGFWVHVVGFGADRLVQVYLYGEDLLLWNFSDCARRKHGQFVH